MNHLFSTLFYSNLFNNEPFFFFILYLNNLNIFFSKKKGYIGEFEIVDDHRGGKIVVELIGRINKCGVISPRFDITLNSLEQWTSNILPSRQFGFLVLTTSYGIMDHEEARRKHTGGKVKQNFIFSFFKKLILTLHLLKNWNFLDFRIFLLIYL